ncbi:hypothetical protein S7711_10394 [Stachybotrys chartarum IBT 7711]|uniref:AB hydrolase-1 domain-containing protein n=1 Tax=Stachybotrys chartarum (strain CBS 109288 / IBT 7711) TaxID=1280523 RepID=A0A084B0D8_STACB|nr:hypothetical protein S7711_10394 [Stachybotrys chartarum IBT 7711]KFA46992.1 hypothetical protein S40293_08993 [Stachybotrys chartarum IBT 40293]KFA78187.1 hypothetical protein S40288_10608 [Stachybotrys chartarum IBT 40288]
MKLSDLVGALTVFLAAGSAAAQADGTIIDGPFPEDLNGSNFTYPWPIQLFRFTSQFQQLDMAFMDVRPACNASNGRTAVLLHGRNFCGATWEGTIRALTASGYRVVAPDQVGFCKSTKPENYQFSLEQLAWNTRGLLQALDVNSFTLIGHSYGGMLTTRIGLQYPGAVAEVVLLCPVGLEDYVREGVPYIGLDQHRLTESRSNYTSIREYQRNVYYVGQWEPEYDVWVTMSVNIYYGSQRELFLRSQARIIDSVLTGPVVPYFQDLLPRTLLIVGERDRTAIGSGWAPPEVAQRLGRFDVLGPRVAAQLRNGQLLSYPDLGHAPHISHPDIVHRDLLDWLTT